MSRLAAVLNLCALVAAVAVGISGGSGTLVILYATFALIATSVGMVLEEYK